MFSRDAKGRAVIQLAVAGKKGFENDILVTSLVYNQKSGDLSITMPDGSEIQLEAGAPMREVFAHILPKVLPAQKEKLAETA